MAFFAKAAAKKAASAALKNVAKVGTQSIGNVRKATIICQNQVKQCILKETAKMKTDLAKAMVKVGEKMQKVQGGRRRSRKRKRSRTKKHRRRGSKRRRTKHRRTKRRRRR